MWKGDIGVELKIKNLRVGSGVVGNVDLPTLPANYLGSSVKGILKKAARKVIISVGNHNPIIEKVVFGDENREGKIQIVACESGGMKNTRFGIKIDPKTGSVRPGHLFSYEYLQTNNLKFLIRPILPLSDEEALLIYHALNFLRYESFGGFGSRGFGLIENVHISENFKEYVRRELS